MVELLEIDIEQIAASPHQPRTAMKEEELEELTQSIRAVGVLQPPLVRRIRATDRFELIAGERRFRAAKRAGICRLKVLVRSPSEEQAAKSALIENIQRSDLNPLEIARALDRLMRGFGYTQEEVAQRIGKPRSTVANYLRLLSLNDEEQQSVSKGIITLGHAKVLLSLRDNALRQKMHRKIITKQLTVRQTERLLQTPTKKGASDPHLRDLCQRLEDRLGVRVTIQTKRGHAGKLIIDYYDLDDLDRILEVIES